MSVEDEIKKCTCHLGICDRHGDVGERIAQLEAELSECKEAVNQAVDGMNHHAGEVLRLQAEVRNLQAWRAKDEGLMEAQAKAIDSLTKQNAELKATIEQKHEINCGLTDNRDALQAENANLRSGKAMLDLTETNMQLCAKVEELREQNARVVSDNLTLVNSLEQEGARLEAMQRENAELRKDRDRLDWLGSVYESKHGAGTYRRFVDAAILDEERLSANHPKP